MLLSACADKEEAYTDRTVEELYNTAMDRFETGKYEKAAKAFAEIPIIERDQKPCEQSLKAFEEVVTRFPSSPYAKDAKFKVDLILDHLAGKEMDVGRYYQRQAAYLPAINRFKEVVTRYQTTSHVPESLHRMIECYIALGLRKEAQEKPCNKGDLNMLMGLSIRDVVLIEALDLQFHEGFSALTGETGAGKSILLDSLSLALGMRGDTSLIRRGAEQAIVSAEFDLRVLHHNNKSRALLNDHPVSIGLLREIGQLILEIHGQFDHLMNALKNAEEELAHQRTLQEEALKKQVYYKQILGDLEKLSPKEQEEEILLKERQDVAHYGKIADAVQEALTALRTPTDFQTSLYSIQKNLERVNVIELKELKSAAEALDRASIELQEAYEAVARKYGFQPMELYASYQQAQQAVEALGEGDGRLHSYEIAAAKVLSERVMAELPPLKLHHATFRIDVKKGDQPSPRGLDHIEFLIAANKGQELAPLAKSASGGEMARPLKHGGSNQENLKGIYQNLTDASSPLSKHYMKDPWRLHVAKTALSFGLREIPGNAIDPESSYYKDLLEDVSIFSGQEGALENRIGYKNIQYSYYKKLQAAFIRNVRIKSTLHSNLPPFLADELCFKQVILGLISLSFEYSPKGGIIKISTSVKIENDQQFLVVKLEDNGFAFDEKDIRRISERFETDGSRAFDDIVMGGVKIYGFSVSF
eukprot:gene17696-17906_t